MQSSDFRFMTFTGQRSHAETRSLILRIGKSSDGSDGERGSRRLLEEEEQREEREDMIRNPFKEKTFFDLRP